MPDTETPTTEAAILAAELEEPKVTIYLVANRSRTKFLHYNGATRTLRPGKADAERWVGRANADDARRKWWERTGVNLEVVKEEVE